MYTVCPCFVCGKQISYLKGIPSLIDEGVEILIQGSYGSIFDLTEMIIWICDYCLRTREDKIFMVNEDTTYYHGMRNENG